MALSVGESGLLVLLLASVLQQAVLQDPTTTCRIEVDSTRGLWRDVTSTDVNNNNALCTYYSYRETNLTCTSQHCQSGGIVDGDCTLYYNADTAWPCLATCKTTCSHQSKCPGKGKCPCQRSNRRYKDKRMCVPYTKLKRCQLSYINENGGCKWPSCTDTCPNGWCNKIGSCSCLRGFKQDKKTGKCVPKQCLDACVDGTCHVYGNCTCKDGAVTGASDGFQCNTNNKNNNQPGQRHVRSVKPDQDLCKSVTCTNGQCDQESGKCNCNTGYKIVPNNELVCSRIECPDIGQVSYCKRECEQNGCTRANGRCDTGTCICNQGFKKDPGNSNKCYKINCPDWDHTEYCQGRCPSLGCNQGGSGQCVNGQCWCNNGFKKDPNIEYKCNRINCPSSSREDDVYCKSQCQPQCNNGWCSDGGICRCNEGFKKDPNTKYKCNKIICPSASREDDVYCKSQCQPQCNNGWCSDGGICRCNEGFKKDPNTKYKCNKINCPSASREDDVYCKSQCDTHCNNGRCSNGGFCRCNNGFKKDPNTKYTCNKINCPSASSEDFDYCKSQCQLQCNNGGCSDGGICSCNNGFKKDPHNKYKCNKINCPSSSREDYVYCKSQCQLQCNNGWCSDGGICSCNEGVKKDPKTKYKCNKINCPSASREDDVYCKSQCQPQCYNGWCSNEGVCSCNNGFKKDPHNKYKCNKINCPSASREDYVYCKSQCDTHCINGTCSNEGFCICSTDFTNDPKDLYNCINIQCPSSSVRNVTEQTFCKSVCEVQCSNGACDDFGACQCQEGFKRRHSEIYKCDRIRCPARESEDNPYCASQCNITCNNGECDEEGFCKCKNGFKNPLKEVNLSCEKINCSAKDGDDEVYCASQCTSTCRNGECDENGACKCSTGFVLTNLENGTCEKVCNVDQDCPSDTPRCSQNEYCTTSKNLYKECTGKCTLQCQRFCKYKNFTTRQCENGAENFETCLSNCFDKCQIFRAPLSNSDNEGRNWVIVGISLTFLAILIGIVFWTRRFRNNRTRSRDNAATDTVQGGSSKEPGTKSEVPGSQRECDSYLEPRRFGQEASEDGAQYPEYETVEEVFPHVIGPVDPTAPRYHSYLQMADLTSVPSDSPVYLNVPKEQDDKAYENFTGDRVV